MTHDFPRERSLFWILIAVILVGVCSVLSGASASTVAQQDKIAIADDKSVFLSGPGEADAWFESLTYQDLKKHWSHDEDLVFNKKMKKLRNFETTVFVEVRLVGFNGEGYRKFTINEAELMRYLEASGLNLHPQPYVLHDESVAPQADLLGSSDDSADHANIEFDSLKDKKTGSRLPTRRKYMFKVTKAKSDLSLKIAAKVQELVNEQATRHKEYKKSSDGSHVPNPEDVWYHIPHSEIDALLKEDYGASTTYTIYILSPSAPFLEVQDTEEGRGTKRVKNTRRVAVRYVYSELDRVALAREKDPTLLTRHTCETTLWAAERRFAYIDLTAGPAAYGGRVSGDGIFTELSLPRLDRVFQRHEEEKDTLKLNDVVTTRGDSDGMHNENLAQSRGKRRTTGSAYGSKKRPTAGTGSVLTSALSAEEKVRRDYLTKGLEFVAGVARVIRQTAESLISPAVYKFPVPYADRVVVNVITLADHELSEGDVSKRWQLVGDQLQRLAFEYQDVEVDITNIQFEDCELCVSALTSALRTHTSNVLTRAHGEDGFEAPVFKTKIHQYVDSAQLVDWLEHFERGFWKLRSGKAAETRKYKMKRSRNPRYGGQGRKVGDSAETGEATTMSVSSATEVELRDGEVQGLDVKVVTVFVFDLATKEALLLDRMHQAVAIGDVVVAVQTQAAVTGVDAVCNGQSMQIAPNDASRAVLGALLSSLYGVMPSGQVFNPYTNNTSADLMWAVGLTPYGHYAHGLDMHFGLVDAAHRHVVLSDVVDVLDTVEEARLLMKQFRKSIADITNNEQYRAFNNRYNLLSFKLQKVMHLLSVNDYNEALFYARSARHDAYQMHHLIYSALSKLETAMVCSTELQKREAGGVTGTIATAIGSIGTAAHSKLERARMKAAIRKQRLEKELSRGSRNARNKQRKLRKTALSAEMNDIESYLALIEDYETDLRSSFWLYFAEVVVFLIVLMFAAYCVLVRSVAAGNQDAVTRFGADMFDLNQRAAQKNNWFGCCRKAEEKRFGGRYD